MSELVADQRLGGRRLLSTGVLLALCASLLTVGFLTTSELHQYAGDFRGQYLGGARHVVAGEPLYVSPDLPDFRYVHAYVYPPLLAVALVPLTVLSDEAATVVAAAGCLLAVLGALWLVGVRDVRCYAATVASAPAWNILETGNLTALLTLALALGWRYRGTVWPLAWILGLAIATKMFLWPLVVWAAVTRRTAAAVRAVALAAGAIVCSWAVVGFQGLRDYPALLQRLHDTWAAESYSIVGMSEKLGLSETTARGLMAVVGGSLLVACWSYGRRRDDLRSLTYAIAAALALTPIAWIHYLLLLLVPLAVVRPRFSAVWLLPLLTWFVPRTGNAEWVQPYLPALAGVSLITFLIVSRSGERTVAGTQA